MAGHNLNTWTLAHRITRKHTRTLRRFLAAAKRRRYLTTEQQLIATLAEAVIQRRAAR